MTPEDFLVIFWGCVAIFVLITAWQFLTAPATIAALLVLWHRYSAGRPIGELVETVKASQYSGTEIMSSGAVRVPSELTSSLQTDGVQTSDQTIDPAARRAKLLDTYRRLRKLGMSRDDARALLSLWGIPLDNNLWAEAAPPDPPEEPTILTPIAGRPTKASYYEADPELAYQPPPR